jgi:RHS repeat-associated protein
VDSKNQLTSATPVGSLTYDTNGNVTVSGSANFSYDDENRLVEYTASYKDVFIYDGLGRLRKRIEYVWTGFSWSENGGAEYIYDGWRVIQERTTANTPTVSYTRGTDLSGSLEGAGGIGGLLARSHGYSSGNWSTHNFYHADGNGNITYLVNSSQTVAASYRYDPFGNLVSSSGGLATANVYRFSSKEVHLRSGMYYYGYRFYDPNLQRWINRDPIEERGGINLYGFVVNYPIGGIDPFGLAQICVNANCAGIDLSGFSYVAEEEPRAPSQPPPKPVLRQLPKPGECVEADAVYEPGKATKTGNCGGGSIDCSSGKPVFKYVPCVPFDIKHDGCEWPYTSPQKDPPHGRKNFPSPDLPPYKNTPTTTSPPLNPYPQPPPPKPEPPRPGPKF